VEIGEGEKLEPRPSGPKSTAGKGSQEGSKGGVSEVSSVSTTDGSKMVDMDTGWNGMAGVVNLKRKGAGSSGSVLRVVLRLLLFTSYDC